MSKTVLNERFRQLVGAPPMQYLAGWRMRTARRAPAARTGPERLRRRLFGRLQFGSRIQPRVQARIWRPARDMAQEQPSRGGATVGASGLVARLEHERPDPAARQREQQEEAAEPEQERKS